MKRKSQNEIVHSSDLKERGYEDTLVSSGALRVWKNIRTGVSLLLSPVAKGNFKVNDRFKNNQEDNGNITR